MTSLSNIRTRLFSPTLLLVWIFYMSVSPQAWSQNNLPDVSELPTGFFSDDPFWTVEFDHLTGVVSVLDESGSTIRRIEPARGAPAQLELPDDRTAIVRVRNANTLLYKYNVAVAPIRQRPASATCSATFAGFGRQAFALGTATITGIAVPGPLGNVGELTTQLLQSNSGQDGFGFSPSPQALLAQARERFEEIELAGRTLIEVAGSLFDELSSIAVEAESSPMEELLESLRTTVDERVPGAASIQGAAKYYYELLSALDELSVEVSAMTQPSVSAGAADLLLEVDFQKQSLKNTRTTHLDALRFADQAEADARRAYSVGETKDTYFRISVSQTADVDERLSAQPLYTRSHDLFVRPSEPAFRCKLGIALLWSESNPTYGVDLNGLIEDTRQRKGRISPNLLFSLSPTSFEALALNLGIGMGELDSPDFLVGLSLATFGGLQVGGGVMWKRASRLPSGFSVGMPIENLSLDNLNEPYVRTAYFGIVF